jgi:hypothetical protein
MISLELARVARAGAMWRTTWRVRSDDERKRTLVSAHAPHVRFRSEPTAIGRPLTADLEFALDINTDGAPGPLDTNPFLILVVRDDEATWRLLYRLTVSIGDDGTPHAAVGPVTTQRAGTIKEES